MAPSPAGCQALPCTKAASYWLAGPHHKAIGGRILGGGGVLGLMLALPWAELDSGVGHCLVSVPQSTDILLVEVACS